LAESNTLGDQILSRDRIRTLLNEYP